MHNFRSDGSFSPPRSTAGRLRGMWDVMGLHQAAKALDVPVVDFEDVALGRGTPFQTHMLETKLGKCPRCQCVKCVETDKAWKEGLL